MGILFWKIVERLIACPGWEKEVVKRIWGRVLLMVIIFGLFTGAGFGYGFYWVLDKRYQGVIDQKEQRIRNLEAAQSVKPLFGFSDQSNREVKVRTRTFLDGFQQFISQSEGAMQSQGILATASRAVIYGSNALPAREAQEYDKHFAPQAQQLVNELLARIPAIKVRNRKIPSFTGRTLDSLYQEASTLRYLEGQVPE